MAVFSLAGLLRLRRLSEERAAYEMVRARSRASELASERHQLLEQLGDHGHDAADVRGLAALSAARASTATMLSDLGALAATQQRIVAETEARHREALRNVKTVEKLEERHDEATRQDELRAEQTALDEIAGRAHGAMPEAGERGAGEPVE